MKKITFFIIQDLKYITYISELLPFLLCSIFLKRIVTKGKKVFFLYTIVIAILVIVGFSLLYIYNSRENYILVVRVYNVIEYTLLAYFFSLYLKNKYISRILIFSSIGFLIFCISSFINTKTPEMPFVPASVEHILLLIFIIYYLFEVMQETVLEPIYQKAIFWISVAFIINSAGNFFLFLYSQNSYKDEIFQKQYIIIYATVTVIKNVLLCISILIKEKKDTPPPDNLFDFDLDALNPNENKP